MEQQFHWHQRIIVQHLDITHWPKQYQGMTIQHLENMRCIGIQLVLEIQVLDYLPYFQQRQEITARQSDIAHNIMPTTQLRRGPIQMSASDIIHSVEVQRLRIIREIGMWLSDIEH